ncbi:hypothetical protein Drorol1_Dr00020299, partial [Drosera rotundifolia]
MQIYHHLFYYPPRASLIRAPIVASASPVDPFTSHHFGYGGLAGPVKVVVFLGDDKGNGDGRNLIRGSLDRGAEGCHQDEQSVSSGVAIDAFVAARADLVAGLGIHFVENLE